MTGVKNCRPVKGPGDIYLQQFFFTKSDCTNFNTATTAFFIIFYLKHKGMKYIYFGGHNKRGDLTLTMSDHYTQENGQYSCKFIHFSSAMCLPACTFFDLICQAQ